RFDNIFFLYLRRFHQPYSNLSFSHPYQRIRSKWDQNLPSTKENTRCLCARAVLNGSRRNRRTLPSTSVLDHSVSKVVVRTTDIGAIYKLLFSIQVFNSPVYAPHGFRTIQSNVSLKLNPTPDSPIPAKPPAPIPIPGESVKARRRAKSVTRRV
ncbi:hypothetical protein BDN72DRAFT_965885, partial [Pluteus cervinus]